MNIHFAFIMRLFSTENRSEVGQFSQTDRWKVSAPIHGVRASWPDANKKIEDDVPYIAFDLETLAEYL
jgi:hypothetical protein